MKTYITTISLLTCLLCTSWIFGQENLDELKVLSFNVQFLRVPFAKDAPGVEERSKVIADYVKDYDVVVFQEAFDREAVKNLLAGMARNGFNYSTRILGFGIHEAGKDDDGLGKSYLNGSMELNPNMPLDKYDAGSGTRKWAPKKLMDIGLDIAEVAAKAVDLAIKIITFGQRKGKVEEKIKDIEGELDSLMQNGGVLIVSKYKILSPREYIYEEPPMEGIDKDYLKPKDFSLKKAFAKLVNWDWFANKGVLYAKILKAPKSLEDYRKEVVSAKAKEAGVQFPSPLDPRFSKYYDITTKEGFMLREEWEKTGKPYHIFGTHTNALYRGANDELRKKLTKTIMSECDQMANFIGSLKIPKEEAVIMAGDFNINQFKANDDKYPYKDIFNHMKQVLHAYVPELKGPQCIKDNDIAGIKPTCEPSRIDYVMFNELYRKPIESFNQFVLMRATRAWDYEGKHHSLSDHDGMYGYFKFMP